MARRKALLHAYRQDASSSHASTSTRSQLSAREYYNARYEKVDKCHRSTTLYADVTNSHINRLEGLWREYCDAVDIDPYYTLKRSMEGRIKNFFHWMCNNYSIKKISSVETYWHQLSQLYIKRKGRRKYFSERIRESPNESVDANSDNIISAGPSSAHKLAEKWTETEQEAKKCQ